MQYPMTHVLLITSVSMVVLFLVLTALAVMVNWLLKVMPERDATREAETATGQPPVAARDAAGLDQLAAVIGVALARARAGRETPLERERTSRVGFNPWRDLPRSRAQGSLDRGWRPR